MSKARRCPACGLVNRPTVTHCECGYGFDGAAPLAKSPLAVISDESPEDQRHQHMHTLTTGWLMVAGFVLIMVVSIATLVLASPIAIFPALSSVVMLRNGVKRIGAGRAGVRAVNARFPEPPRLKLPRAKLLTR
jgi:hypothetical protein